MKNIVRLKKTANSRFDFLKAFSILTFILLCVSPPLEAKTLKNKDDSTATNYMAGTGLARLTDPGNMRMQKMGLDLAKANALLALRKSIYRTVAADGELLGIFVVKNSSMEPLINNLLNNVTFSKPQSIIPDLIEIEATISILPIQKIIAPILLGKNPSNIELTTDDLTAIAEDSENQATAREITLITPEGSGCAVSFFPSISSHDSKLAGELQQKLANYVIDGGKLLYKKRTGHKGSDSEDTYLSDSLGGIRKSTIYLTDSDSARLTTAVANMNKPDQSKIYILID